MGNFNPNYFDRKAGSLERAVLDAVNGVQSQINENQYYEYKFKNKNDAMKAKSMLDGIQLMNFDINDDNISNGELMVDAGKKNMSKYHNMLMKQFKPKVMAQEKKKLDPVGKSDGDIDNDGDKDSSDEYLAKRRAAIGKAMKKEETIFEAVGKDIAKKMMGSKSMKSFASKVAKMKTVTKGDLENMLPDYVAGADISKLFEADTTENYDIGTPENTNAKLDATPGQSSDEWNQQVGLMQKKNMSMREALAKVWGFDEGKNPFKKEEKVPKGFHRMTDGSLMKDSDMDKKENKTMTGKPATKVSVDPDMKEKRN